MRLGRYPFQRKAPLTPGYCLVGKVVRNGPGCSQFQQGDTVAALTVYDAEADLVNVEEKCRLRFRSNQLLVCTIFKIVRHVARKIAQ